MASHRKSKSNFLKTRKYKQKLGKLAYLAAKGDIKSEQKLKKELKTNPVAYHLLDHILRSNTLDSYAPRSEIIKMKTGRTATYGNAFIPFQGGLPGLGKKN